MTKKKYLQVKRRFYQLIPAAWCSNRQQKSKQMFFPWEKPNSFQVGIGYLEFDLKVTKIDNTYFFVSSDVITNEVIRLVNSAFVFTLLVARNSTFSGTELEQNKNVDPICTTLRFVTGRYGDLSTYFDKIE